MSVVATFTPVYSVTILQLEPYYVLTDVHVCKVDNSQNDSYVCTSACLFELFRVRILSASYKPAYLGSLMPSVFTIFFTTYAMRALGRRTHPLHLFRQKSSAIASKATEIQGATSKLSCRQIKAAFSRWSWTLCEYTAVVERHNVTEAMPTGHTGNKNILCTFKTLERVKNCLFCRPSHASNCHKHTTRKRQSKYCPKNCNRLS